MRTIAPLAFAAASMFLAGSAPAQGPDIHVDVPANAKHLEVNVVEHDFAPGATSGWHIHHGHEIAYVLSGEMNVQIAGGPIRHVVKGDTFEVDRDTPHRAMNASTSEPAALLITYLKDKNGPLMIPVQPPSPR
jgi:quercetin dioxygenase-like cupin family protein